MDNVISTAISKVRNKFGRASKAKCLINTSTKISRYASIEIHNNEHASKNSRNNKGESTHPALHKSELEISLAPA